ncbi:MAG: tRNA uridine-5-carboxymethylaminomethyl(34) synthesis GTPase MnmE [Clostridia bacterium]|nr:tRNA uridine-5-carboxymethylaminomethyl(34) synthesis GTPase MnmE [Clostridia bacterium]
MGDSDTVAAISTPPGVGGIAIIRISGANTFPIVDKLFRPGRKDRSAPTEAIKPGSRWRARYGRAFGQDGEFIDEVILLTMPSPLSYTREDVAEISCHGGTAVARGVLKAVLDAGARHAEPGEFTKRAFLNGRIDLSQAEAVLEMVNSRTERARRAASEFMSGNIGGGLLASRAEIADLMTRIEASLDFPEDDIPGVELEEIAARASEIAAELENATNEALRGRILWEGTSVAIVGRPNVGKSRLLNALLREERAIVSESPGTTRDTVSEVASINGIPVRLVDTAGLRQSEDPVERIGVERARTALAEAEIVLAVIDGSVAVSPDDREILSCTPQAGTVVVVNKSDLSQAVVESELALISGPRPVVHTSAVTGMGITRLEHAIEEMVLSRVSGAAGAGETDGFSSRRSDCLRRAAAALRDVRQGARDGMPPDMLSIDLRAAADALSELTGATTREDIINRIFEQFCIGK